MEQRISFLLQQRFEQKLTAAESEELLTILQHAEYDAVVTDLMQQMALVQEQGPAIDPAILRQRVSAIMAVDKAEGVGGLYAVEKEEKAVHALEHGSAAVGELKHVAGNEKTIVRMVGGPRVKTAWYKYAAAVLILVGIGAYLLYTNRRPAPVGSLRQDLAKVVDIAPGGNVAVLTLADGSRIALDSATNGLLSQQGNTKVVKSGSGQLAYTMAGSGISAGAMTYNSITTPRGGQYQVVLPDGSKVWLNASSSLRFPTAFTGRDRTVEITGEAYFVIAKDEKKPFFVKAGALSVAVLGTEFNINTYADEPVIKTTLVQGGIRLQQGSEVAQLSPGQQAQIQNVTSAQSIKISNDADLEEAVAWKNGKFHLASADVGAIMRQLSRWYNVEVVFEGGVPSGHITGELPRSTSLLKTLEVFETSGIHFRVDNRKIIVTP